MSRIICQFSDSMKAITRVRPASRPKHQVISRDPLLSLSSLKLFYYPQTDVSLPQSGNLLENSESQFGGVQLVLGTVARRRLPTDGRQLEAGPPPLLGRPLACLDAVQHRELLQEFFMFPEFLLISAGGLTGSQVT